MRIHVIKGNTVIEYVGKEGKNGIVFSKWLKVIKEADVNNMNDLIRLFNTTDSPGKGSHRLCFNIGGNNYRLICKLSFGKTKCHMFISWIGTHAEYDKLCKEKMQFTVEAYKY